MTEVLERTNPMTLADAPNTTITCAVTGKTVETTANADGSPKLPRGWKRHAGKDYSPAGFAGQYVQRAVRLPVASVTVEGSDDRQAGWKAFWTALRAAWGDATRYANLAISNYAAKDFSLPLEKTDDGKIRLPKIDRETQNAWRREVYALHHDFPAIDATSAAAISMECWRTWLKWRWDVRVTGKRALPTFRYPLPVPLPAQGVKWSVDPGNGYVTGRMRVNGSAFLARLSASRDHARQIDTLRTALKEAHRIGETSLLLRNNQPWVAVTVSLPKRPVGVLDPARTLAVKLGGGDLFRAVVDGAERVWTLHADDFLGRVERWDERRQRFSDDRKFERRRGKRRERYQALSESVTERHHRWLTNQLHIRSRELVEFAKRQRCGRIEIDATTPPSGVPNHRMLEMVRQKADEYGMIVRVTGDKPEADASAAVV